MNIEKLLNNKLRGYVEATGLAGLFSLYVIDKKPFETSLAVIEDSKVIGAAISGRDFELYEAYSHWIFANHSEAALQLAKALISESLSINFPLSYFDQFHKAFIRQQFSVDRFYVLPPSKLIAQSQPRADLAIINLYYESITDLTIADELKQFLGPLESLDLNMQLYGIVEKQSHQLLTIAEMMVQSDDRATIQQGYTITSHRGHGLGQFLVG